MQKLICDKCGEEIDDEMTEIVIKPRSKLEVFGKSLVVNEGDSCYDFCNNCANLLVKWIKNGAENS